MTTLAQRSDSAYGAFARYYDRFTANHDYDLWIAIVERLARRHGFTGGPVTDAACGTGKSFLPLARRGHVVSAFDRSHEMLAIAAAKCQEEGLSVELVAGDLRRPPALAPAALVTCLDDVLNYQLGEDDLDALLAGLRRLMSPSGVAVFDINTRSTYASSYTRSSEVRDAALTMRWQGRHVAGDVYEATVAVHDAATVLRSVHRQRYWASARVQRAIARAGLRSRAVYGMSRDGSITCPPDDDRHTKFLFVVSR